MKNRAEKLQITVNLFKPIRFKKPNQAHLEKSLNRF